MNRLKALANDWIGLIALVGLMVTGFLHLSSKIDGITVGMHKQFQDFHGRLERQDAEFKAHMRYYHSAEDA